MQRFASLTRALSNSTRTNDKRDALLAYLRSAPDADKIWLVALFTGRRPKRLVNSTLLKSWCMELAEIRPWLFDESYHTVGDLSEAIALMLPEPEAGMPGQQEEIGLADMMQRLGQLQAASEEEKKEFILHEWRTLSRSSCFVFNKLILGGFRIGVSEALVIQALALFLEQDPQAVAHLLSGSWDPYTTTFPDLLQGSEGSPDLSKPYPFYLAYPLEGGPETLGAPAAWQVEWKWDGIRGQLIRRGGNIYLWSRGEDLVTDRFPEIASLLDQIPDGTALDGEILAYREGMPIAFQYLQTRVTRKTVSKKQLTEAPVVFMVYDILEWEGTDIRQTPQSGRRALLEDLVKRIHSPHLVLSQEVVFETWDDLRMQMDGARDLGCEGFMLKRMEAVYQAGRRRGDWWKWKVDPLSIDAVLLYAQKGSGKRSGLYTDYTFAVRDGDKLVPFAKAYSGLTDKEIAQVDKWVKANGVETFGPVRTVKPTLVFEIGFEGIGASPRHKSGVAVRFPRMLKWRTDKGPQDADTIETLKAMLEKYGKMG